MPRSAAREQRNEPRRFVFIVRSYSSIEYFREETVARVPGVVHEPGDRSGLVGDAAEGLLHAGLVGHVQEHGDAGRAGGLERVERLLRVRFACPIPDGDGPARAGERLRACAADAAGSARDDRHLRGHAAGRLHRPTDQCGAPGEAGAERGEQRRGRPPGSGRRSRRARARSGSRRRSCCRPRPRRAPSARAGSPRRSATAIMIRAFAWWGIRTSTSRGRVSGLLEELAARGRHLGHGALEDLAALRHPDRVVPRVDGLV